MVLKRKKHKKDIDTFGVKYAINKFHILLSAIVRLAAAIINYNASFSLVTDKTLT